MRTCCYFAATQQAIQLPSNAEIRETPGKMNPLLSYILQFAGPTILDNSEIRIRKPRKEIQRWTKALQGTVAELINQWHSAS